jgi:hypothetical protein
MEHGNIAAAMIVFLRTMWMRERGGHESLFKGSSEERKQTYNLLSQTFCYWVHTQEQISIPFQI